MVYNLKKLYLATFWGGLLLSGGRYFREGVTTFRGVATFRGVTIFGGLLLLGCTSGHKKLTLISEGGATFRGSLLAELYSNINWPL